VTCGVQALALALEPAAALELMSELFERGTPPLRSQLLQVALHCIEHAVRCKRVSQSSGTGRAAAPTVRAPAAGGDISAVQSTKVSQPDAEDTAEARGNRLPGLAVATSGRIAPSGSALVPAVTGGDPGSTSSATVHAASASGLWLQQPAAALILQPVSQFLELTAACQAKCGHAVQASMPLGASANAARNAEAFAASCNVLRFLMLRDARTLPAGFEAEVRRVLHGAAGEQAPAGLSELVCALVSRCAAAAAVLRGAHGQAHLAMGLDLVSVALEHLQLLLPACQQCAPGRPRPDAPG
jgi:hypothetical protein